MLLLFMSLCGPFVVTIGDDVAAANDIVFGATAAIDSVFTPSANDIVPVNNVHAIVSIPDVISVNDNVASR